MRYKWTFEATVLLLLGGLNAVIKGLYSSWFGEKAAALATSIR